jgi:hypothetical protein
MGAGDFEGREDEKDEDEEYWDPSYKVWGLVASNSLVRPLHKFRYDGSFFFPSSMAFQIPSCHTLELTFWSAPFKNVTFNDFLNSLLVKSLRAVANLQVLKWLHRDPSPAQLRTFLTVFEDGANGPKCQWCDTITEICIPWKSSPGLLQPIEVVLKACPNLRVAEIQCPLRCIQGIS